MRFFISSLFFFIYTLSFSQLISFQKINQFTVDQLNQKWQENSIPQFIAPVNYLVDVYDVLYYTEWYDGTLIQASGLYFVPHCNNSPLLVYNHGTRITKQYRDIDCTRENLLCLIFATDGYSVAIPDYVGLGHGENQHLYMHADSEANAGIYFLKAIAEINEKLDIELNNQLFITGYSQGGHATLALHKKIQEDYKDYCVTASSPMSGPYDPLDIQGRVMFKPYSQPHYLPYLLLSYNKVYNIFSDKDFYNIFNHPYDSIILDVFSPHKKFKGNPLDEINSVLPTIPVDMIKQDIVSLYHEDYDFLKVFLKENSVYDWKPDSPVQFCYCKSDEEVLYENSILAYNSMKKNGAKFITKKCISRKYNHVECAGFSAIHTKFFFDSFRKGSLKGRRGPFFKRFAIKIIQIFK